MKFILYLIFLFVWVGCGVKGDPLPPEKPPELGRGRPTYKGAARNLRIPLENEDEDEEEDDDDEDSEEDDE